MNSQIDKWQNEFMQATPTVDTSLLTERIVKARRKEQITGWLELILSLAVSLYCLIASAWLATSLSESVVYAVLAPVPSLHAWWTFRLRQQQWRTQLVDVNSLLSYKRTGLTNQLRLWRSSQIIGGILYTGLILLAVYNYVTVGNVQLWLIQLGVNGLILLLIVLRYQYLKRQFPSRCAAIDSIAAQ